MPRRCTVCDHKARMAIELEMRTDSVQQIATRYSVTPMAVRWHKTKHLQPKVKAALARRELKAGDKLVDHVLRAITVAQDILDSAEDSEQKLRALDRVFKGLEVGGKFTGEIAAPQVQTFVLSLGVTEEQLRKLAEQHKQLESMTWEDALEEALDVLAGLVAEHPECAARVRTEVLGEVQLEEGQQAV